MITKKLLEFQKLDIKIERDSMNPHYKSSYSSLNEVLAKVKKPLNDLGVLIFQKPENEGAVAGLETILLDTGDDTKVSCFVPFVNATDMQKLGGAITYARRYSLVTLLGLEDADDDGNVASEPKPKSTNVIDRTDAPFGSKKAEGSLDDFNY